MTRTELETRARDRALAENIRVHPIAGSNGCQFAATSTTTQPGGFWPVYVDIAGTPTCTCPAGQNGRPCKHAEAVAMHLYETRMLAQVKARQMADLAAIFE